MDQATPILTLPELAARIVAPGVEVRFHPTFLGYQSRADGWQAHHWQPRGESHILMLVHDGSITITCPGEEPRICGPGAALLLRPDLRPDIAFSNPLVFREVYFRVTDGGQEFWCDRPARFTPNAWALAGELDALADALQTISGQRELLARHRLALMLVQLDDLERRDETPAHTLSSQQRTRLVQFVRKRLAKPLSPEDLAEAVGLSHDYFSRRFRVSFGMSPRDWLVEERIREASRLLRHTDLRVKEIAQAVGYGSQASFTRQFTRLVGVSPHLYRNAIDLP